MSRREVPQASAMPDPYIALAAMRDPEQPLCIYGTYTGDIEAAQLVFIGEKARVHGNIVAYHIIVRGAVAGSLCAERIEIHRSGRVWGNLCAQMVFIEPGAFVRGHVLAPYERSALVPAPPDDDLETLLEGESAEPVAVKEVLTRAVEAKNRMIFQLQMELHAAQAGLEEQHAQLSAPTVSAPESGNGRKRKREAKPPSPAAPADLRRAEAALRQKSLRDALSQLAEDLDVARQEIVQPHAEPSVTEFLSGAPASAGMVEESSPALMETGVPASAGMVEEAPPALMETGVPASAGAAEESPPALMETGVPASAGIVEEAPPAGPPLPTVTRIAVNKLISDLEQARNRLARLHEEQTPAPVQPEQETGGRRQEAGSRRQEEMPAPEPEQAEPPHNTAYCLTCRAHRPIEELGALITPDGRSATKGRCVICGATVLKLSPPAK